MIILSGHGIGLEMHEQPFLVGSNHVPLEAGNTFTTEPGIYIPGELGVRLEDIWVLRKHQNGSQYAELLTPMATSPFDP